MFLISSPLCPNGNSVIVTYNLFQNWLDHWPKMLIFNRIIILESKENCRFCFTIVFTAFSFISPLSLPPVWVMRLSPNLRPPGFLPLFPAFHLLYQKLMLALYVLSPFCSLQLDHIPIDCRPPNLPLRPLRELILFTLLLDCCCCFLPKSSTTSVNRIILDLIHSS